MYINSTNKPTEHLLSGSGIYTLMLEIKEKKYLRVGALGRIEFPAGFYAYTGSARGPGGFARVSRHLDVAGKSNPTRRWHIDYLLPHTEPLGAVLTATQLDIECKISNILGSDSDTFSGFGCTDCGCSGHLHRFRNIDIMAAKVKDAHYQAAGNIPENTSVILFQKLYPQK